MTVQDNITAQAIRDRLATIKQNMSKLERTGPRRRVEKTSQYEGKSFGENLNSLKKEQRQLQTKLGILLNEHSGR